MKFTPVADNVLIEILPKQQASLGGIILPDKDTRFTDNFVLGVVVAVGKGRVTKPIRKNREGGPAIVRIPKVMRIPPQVKPGDKVIVNDHEGLVVIQTRPRQVVCKEEALMAIFEGVERVGH